MSADAGTGTATSEFLPIYLNDHLAAATAAVELVKRAASANEDNELGAFLSGLEAEIADDRRALEEIMAALGAGRDRVKVAAGWAGEKAGRLKLNGRLFSYSPLSPVTELEALALGITGKLMLWRALAELEDERLDPGQLAELIERAERQREDVEAHRLEAAHRALTA